MGKYVNKESLTQTLSIQLNMSKKDAAYAVDLIFNEMSDALANDGHVDITAFGYGKSLEFRSTVEPQISLVRPYTEYQPRLLPDELYRSGRGR